MRILLAVIIAAALAWSAWWWIGSSALRRGLEAWFAARRDEGWVADYAALHVSGFPNRFDTTIDEVALADTETGLAFAAPFVQILALSYRPNHVIAVFPHEWTLSSPLGRAVIESETMRGSVVFEPGTALTLDRATFVIDALSVASGAATTTMTQARMASRRVPAANAHEIGLQLTGLAPPPDLLSRLDPTGSLPPQIDLLSLDAVIGFDAPWDRFALEQARPQPVSIDLDEARASWGRLDLRAAGSLAIDDRGIAEGVITVKAENWREMLAIAGAAGAVPEVLAPTLERALEFLAGLSGSSRSLDVPLTFSSGRVSFGPVPLGRAPVFRLR